MTLARSRLVEGGERITLSYSVLCGKNHIIEYRDDLGPEGQWLPLPGSPHNAGTVMETNVLSQRFYRLRVIDQN